MSHFRFSISLFLFLACTGIPLQAQETVTGVAAGKNYTLVITDESKALGFGANLYGQLGVGSVDQHVIPTELQMPDTSDNLDSAVFTKIDAGVTHSVATDAEGRLFVWGRNNSGQQGVSGQPDLIQMIPTLLDDSGEWTDISAGSYFTLGLKDGALYGWGANESGQQTGDITADNGGPTAVTPPVPGGTWSGIAAGGYHAAGIYDGKLYTWGNNLYGQLGYSTSAGGLIVTMKEVVVSSVTGWQKVVAGEYHTAALSNSGQVWVWGDNSVGQLAKSANTLSSVIPVKVNILDNSGNPVVVTDLFSGDNSLYAVSTQGRVYAWGSNDYGQLGLGSETITYSIPTRINTAINSDGNLVTVTNPLAISSDGKHTVMLLSDGSVILAGNNNRGQLGLPSLSNTPQFIENDLSGSVILDFLFPDFYVGNVTIAKTSDSLYGYREYTNFRFDFVLLALGDMSSIEEDDILRLDLYLSSDLAIGNDYQVDTFYIDLSFAAGSTGGTQVQLTGYSSMPNLPSNFGSGDYYLLFELNKNHEINEGSEANFANNQFNSIALPFPPDFDAGSVYSLGSDEFGIGEEMNVRMYLTDSQGSQWNPTQPAYYDIYLHPLDGSGDILVINDATLPNDAFDQDNYFLLEETFTIPEDTPYLNNTGQNGKAYTLRVFVDPANQIIERDEDNNFSESDSFFILVKRDLELSNFQVGEESFMVGNQIAVKVDITNTGLDIPIGEHPGLSVDFVLSMDQVYGNGDDIEFGTIPVTSDLLNGQSVNLSGLFAPVTDLYSSNYYLLAHADRDDVVLEGDESNNAIVFNQMINLSGDLIISDSAINNGNTVFDFSVNPVDPLNLSLEYSNQGLHYYGNDKALTALIILSTNMILGDSDDFILSTIDFGSGGLMAGESIVANSIDVELPPSIPPGDYYVSIVPNADLSLIEYNYDNNIHFIGASTITILSETPAGALIDHGPAFPDSLEGTLTGNASWWAQSETAYVQSGTFSAQSGDIGNGESTSLSVDISLDTPATIEFYWAIDSEFGFDKLRFTVNGASVTGITPISGDVDLTLVTFDLNPGDYTLKWAYSKDAGTSTGQDAAWVDGLTITPYGGPDFILSTLTYPDGTYVAGQSTIEISTSGTNFGEPYTGGSGPNTGLPDDFVINAYLSANSTFDAGSDFLLGSLEEFQPLGDNNIFVYQDILDIPNTAALPTGNYYLILVITTAESEVSKANNIRVSPSANLTVNRLADLVVTDVQLVTNSAQDFFDIDDTDTLEFNITIANVGDSLVPVGSPMEIYLLLATDAETATGLTLTTHQHSGGLKTGLVNARTLNVTASVPQNVVLGTPYYIGAFIDSGFDVNEADETNNFGATANPDIVFAERALDEAVDYFEESIYASSGISWFGQNTVFADHEDAAQSASVSDGQTSRMEFDLTPTVDSILTFYWKVSSQANSDYLKFFVNDALEEQISGESDFTLYRVFLSSGVPYNLAWVYAKDDGGRAGTDAGWVDKIQINVDGGLPDFVLESVDVTPTALIYGQDSVTLTVTGSNIANFYTGTTTGLPLNFSVMARISQTASFDDGIDLGSMSLFSGLDEGASFAYKETFELPDGLEEGNYFIVLEIDPGVDGVGDPIEEVSSDNNAISTASALVQVTRLPDLLVSSVNIHEPVNFSGLYYSSNNDQIDYTVTITNLGEEAIPAEAIKIAVVLSETFSFSGAGVIPLIEFPYSDGLEVGESFSKSFNSLTDIPLEAKLGTAYNIVAFVDSDGTVGEMDEGNNVGFSSDTSIVLSELTVEESIEVADAVLFPTGVPWFGQSAITSDGIDAAQSAAISHGQTASFEFSIPNDEITTDTFVNFSWKVSSQEDADYLKFFIDGSLIAEISGDQDWTRVGFPLTPGAHTLRWDYVKDDATSAGLDAAWVDNIVKISPDLAPSNLFVDTAGAPFLPGDLIPVSFDISNTSDGNTPEDGFAYQIWLSLDQVIDGEDILLITDSRTDVLGKNDLISIDLTMAPDAPVTPTDIGVAANYFIIVSVDPDAVIAESNEGNNILTTTSALVSIQPFLPLDEALDSDDPLNIDTDDLGIDPLVFATGGNSSWFGQNIEFSNDDDGVQSPELDAGEKAWFETVIPGPLVLEFDWKVNSQNAANYLSVELDSTEKARISGDVDWASYSLFLPAASNTVRFIYTKNVEADDPDIAYLDNLRLSRMTLPDFIFSSVNYDSGNFVVLRDAISITAIGRNQGLATNSLPANFRMTAYLSQNDSFDSELDFFLGYMDKFEDIGADHRFGYLFNTDMEDETLIAGNYYLIVVMDSEDAQAEEDETNNIWVSQTNDINIIRLPDLLPSNLVYDPEFYLIDQQFSLEFSLSNVGLASVEDPFTIDVTLSPDREPGDGDDSLLITINEPEGVPADQVRNYQVIVELPESVEIGVWHSLAINVNPNQSITEINYDNNIAISDDDDVFVQATTLAEALDVNTIEGLEGDLVTFTTDTEDPWFGQTDETFDRVDAAKVHRLADTESSALMLTKTFDFDSEISFYWKSDTERTAYADGSVKEDYLVFTIDGVEQGRISGEWDWEKVKFPISAGQHDLAWIYIKDEGTKSGEDAVWLDKLSFSVPDLALVSFANTTGNTVLQNGDALSYEIEIANFGEIDLPSSPAYTVELRISTDFIWGNGDDYILTQLVNDSGLPRSSIADPITVSINGTTQIPDHLSKAGTYYLGVYVDSREIISEASEGNNMRFIDAEPLSLSPGISISEALDIVEPLDHADGDWIIGGDGTWYGQDIVSVNEDALQASPIGFNEEVYIEREFFGPAYITFNWKVSSLINYNYLQFSINDTVIKRISGEIDWTEEKEVFIPSGRQVLRWTYAKYSSASIGEDTGWVDIVEIDDADYPDLVLTNVDVEEGEYILGVDTIDGSPEDYLRTRFLNIQVEAKNEGLPLENDGYGFTVADVEVRLSTDTVFGNADDYVLGEFARVERSLESNDRIYFLGPIPLGSHLPEGNYHVLARVDPKDNITEISEDNNVKSGGMITITRLPDLVFDMVGFNENKVYYTEDLMQFSFTVNNEGLNVVPDSIDWDLEITLRGLKKEDVTTLFETYVAEGYPASMGAFVADIQGISTPAVSMQTLTISELMNGATDEPGLENGDSIFVNAFASIPRYNLLESSIGINESVSDYYYYFEVNVDAANEIDEIDEENSFLIIDANEFLSLNTDSDRVFEIFYWPTNYVDVNYYNGIYPGTIGMSLLSDDDGDGIPFALEYAFNKDASTSEFEFTSAGNGDVLNDFGWIKVNGHEYLSITFDFIHYSTDLTYTILANDDMDAPDNEWEQIVQLTPPYHPTNSGLDRVGPDTLTGDGGLIENENVLAITEGALSSRITIVDSVAFDSVPSRFLKIAIGLNGVNAPTGLTATTLSSSSILLNWEDNSDNEDNFLLNRALADSGNFVQISVPVADAVSDTDSGLAELTEYDYVIYAYDGDTGSSMYSNVATARTQLNAPGGLTDDDVQANQVDISWTDNSGSEDAYVVERSDDGGTNYSVIATLPADSTAYSDSTVLSGQNYLYRVKATQATHSSDYDSDYDGPLSVNTL